MNVRRFIESGAAVLAAFLAFTLLQRIHPLAVEAVNVFVVVVLLIGLTGGEIAGAVMGAVCGLVADSFSLGIFGIAGIGLTTMGFFTGFISRKINVLRTPRLFLFFALLSAAELGLWAAATALVFGRGAPWSGGVVLLQPVLNALTATVLFEGSRRWKFRHDRTIDL